MSVGIGGGRAPWILLLALADGDTTVWLRDAHGMDL